MRNKENKEDYSYRRTEMVYGIAGESTNKLGIRNKENYECYSILQTLAFFPIPHSSFLIFS